MVRQGVLTGSFGGLDMRFVSSSASVRYVGYTPEEGFGNLGRIPCVGLRNERHAFLLVASRKVGIVCWDNMLCQ